MKHKLAKVASLAVFFLVPALLRAQSAPPPPPTGPAAVAADVNPLGWTAKAGLSFVGTNGNAEATSLGFKFNATYNWTKTYFTLLGGGLRADSTDFSSFAVGPDDDTFGVVEIEDREKTAENYFLEAGLDRNITPRFFWLTGAGWRRDTFAGIDSRIAARAGVGYHFTDPASSGAQFKGSLLATLTNQSETVPNPATDDTFIGLRALLDFGAKFGPGGNSAVNSRFAADENLQSTDDFRMTWWNSLGVSMSDRLALQVALLLSYDNVPALAQVSRYGSSDGTLPIGPPLGSVFVPLKKWDSELSVSVVLNLVPKKPAPPAPPPPPCPPCS
jgi:hypothetical protein